MEKEGEGVCPVSIYSTDLENIGVTKQQTVSWCFEPSNPQSITSGLATNSKTNKQTNKQDEQKAPFVLNSISLDVWIRHNCIDMTNLLPNNQFGGSGSTCTT